MNPLLEIQFRVPFDKIEAARRRARHRRAASRRTSRGWTTTIASERPLHALDTMTEKLDYAMSVVRHLESVATTPELRAAHNAVQPKVSAFYSGLPLNEGLVEGDPALRRHRRSSRAHRHHEALSDQDHRLLQAPRRGARSGGQGAAARRSTWRWRRSPRSFPKMFWIRPTPTNW